jgi:hypothetical protein
MVACTPLGCQEEEDAERALSVNDSDSGSRFVAAAESGIRPPSTFATFVSTATGRVTRYGGQRSRDAACQA